MQTKQRLDALTSLRFLAAAMIVLGHAHPIFGSFGIAMAAPLGQGVSFFFVLSGFILTWNYPVLNNWADRRKFYLARFARIWPLHLVTCLLWIALVFNFDRNTYFPGVEGLVKLFANLLLLQVWMPFPNWGLSFNGVAWSISTEFFFYAMFPLLIALWQRRWHQLLLVQFLVIVTIILVSTFYALPEEDNYQGVGLLGLLYFNPLVRIFEFSIGIALASLVRKVSIPCLQLTGAQWLFIELAAVLMVIIGMLAAANFSGIRQTLGQPVAYYFTREGLWLFWAFLIGVFALSHGALTRFLSFRFIVFLGEISFALYLCHALIIHYLDPYTEQIQPYGLFGYALFWGWCLLFATTLFLGVETPFRKFILSSANKKGVIFSLKAYFGTREITALIVLLCMVLAMFFLRPSTITPIDQASVASFIQPNSENVAIPDNVIFDKRYEVIALRIHASDSSESTLIQVLMRAKQTLLANDILALHILDQNAQIITNVDQKLDLGHVTIPAGTYWIQKFQVSKALIGQAFSLGLAMYNNPSSLFDVEGGNRDWGNKRLLIPMKSKPMPIVSASPDSVELIIKSAQFQTTANFGDYTSLQAIRTQPSVNGEQALDIVFKVVNPLPAGYHLAIHMVAADGTIVTAFDSEIVKNQSIKQGELWVEHIQIPARSLTPQVVKLGVAIYSDPKSPLSVTYSNTDYGGKRMLVDLARIIPPPSCPSGGCELIVKESQLSTPAKFGNYISLLAIRSQHQKNGDQIFDMVFKVEQPLPREHKLAVHIVTADGTIVTQIDTPIVKNRALKSGDLWLEHIQIPARFMTPKAVRLGIAIYADPSVPLSVEYPDTDYGGKRMLVDFTIISLMK